MNKTQRNKAINKLVYQFAESLGYEVDTTELDVMFISPSGNNDDDIQYRRSTQQVDAFNWSSERTKEDIFKFEAYIDVLNGLDNEALQNLINSIKNV